MRGPPILVGLHEGLDGVGGGGGGSGIHFHYKFSPLFTSLKIWVIH